MRHVLWVALLVLPVLAGCVDDEADVDSAQPAPVWTGDSYEFAAADPAGAPTARIVMGEVGPRLPISGDCPCAPIEIEVPHGLLGDRTGWLEVRLDWDGTKSAAFNATLTTANGTVLADTRGFDALRVVAWAPAGTYLFEPVGAGRVDGWIQVREKGARQVPGEDLLPNLQTLVPTDIGFAACTASESTEQGAQRCLRLSNGVANTGDGPLEVRLTFPDGILAAGALGQFVQRLYGAEGGYRHVPVGGAEYHLAHGHYHYAGLAHFVLYDFDPETGLRGDQVDIGRKAGFCFLDWAPMHEPEFDPDFEGAHAEQDCLVPAVRVPSEPSADIVYEEGWAMGISPSWYDLYWADLDDQYIETSGLPDGTYELVSVADAPATLLEIDETDNAASAIIRITGDNVVTLEGRGFYTRSSGDL